MNKDLSILITYPPIMSQKGVAMLTQNRQFQWLKIPSCLFPLVAASAATLLREKGYTVHWKDGIAEEMPLESYLDYVSSTHADIIVLEAKTPIIRKMWQMVDKLKECLPDAKVVLMGDHVTALPEETLKESNVDYVLTGGDYDFMLLSLCNHLTKGTELELGFWYRKDGQITNNGPFSLRHNLDELPMIDRDFTKALLYTKEKNIKYSPYLYTMAGRDCPYGKCTFCSWTTLYPQFKVMSVEKYLNEVGELIEKYDLKEIFDDTGTFPGGAWLDTFCKGMIERGYNKRIAFSCNMRADYISEDNAKLMKEAGFRLIKTGLESASQSTLDRIKKNVKIDQIYEACRVAKAAGLEVHLTVMVGYPWENKIDAQNSRKMLKYLMDHGHADVFQSTIVVPYPGTPLHKEAVENDWFRIDPTDYERYDMKFPVLKTGDMSPEDVTEQCNKMFRVYFSPRHLIHKLIHLKPDEFGYYFKGAIAAVGHLFDFNLQHKDKC